MSAPESLLGRYAVKGKRKAVKESLGLSAPAVSPRRKMPD
jgi:hypothetical protein